LPGTRDSVVPFARLSEGHSIAVKECGRVIGEVQASLEEGLEKRNKGAAKIFQTKKKGCYYCLLLQRGATFY
jgi:hypothetical protein